MKQNHIIIQMNIDVSNIPYTSKNLYFQKSKDTKPWNEIPRTE